jgi:DtxR family Mn-dependent transcriptional regulator
MTEKQSVKKAEKNVETRAVENFLKAVYVLQQALPDGEERVSTNALKDALQKSAPSVTDMAQRLTEAHLIDYEKYYGVRLTETGSAIALKIIRRHRLIELYLVNELGYALHEVHDEAEELEHTVSDRFIQAIAEKLGNPQFDPHGDPIPAPDGTIQSRNLQPLSELALLTPARVSRLMAETPDKLQHTLDRGFTLNTLVEVVSRDPFEGPLTIKLDDGQTIIGHALAAVILVEVVE